MFFFYSVKSYCAKLSIYLRYGFIDNFTLCVQSIGVKGWTRFCMSPTTRTPNFVLLKYHKMSEMKQGEVHKVTNIAPQKMLN